MNRFKVTLSSEQFNNYLDTHLKDKNTKMIDKIRNRTGGQAFYSIKGVTNVKMINSGIMDSFNATISFDDEARYNWFLLQI